LWQGESGAAFEEASIHPHLQAGSPLDRIVVTTVEYRGVADVDRATATSDAQGLYRLLVARGVISVTSIAAPGPFKGVVEPLEYFDLMPAAKAGAVLYDVKPGDRVRTGDRLATLVHRPGEPDGHVEIFAPQDGFILTRRSHRVTRAGDDLVKLVGERKSGDARSGTLED
jgi:predicted deacylase